MFRPFELGRLLLLRCRKALWIRLAMCFPRSAGPEGGTPMKSDPEDEPGIYLFYALMMLVAFIAASLIAARILIHVSS